MENCAVLNKLIKAGLVATTEADANAALERLTKKARDIESDPCEIKSEIVAVENGVQLNASFTFSCQAEAMIFELANR